MFFKLILFSTYLLDWYLYQAIKAISKNASNNTKRLIKIIFWSQTIIGISFISFSFIVDFPDWHKFMRTYPLSMIFLLQLSKLIASIFLFLNDIFRVLHFTTIKSIQKIKQTTSNNQNMMTRSAFISKLALISGGIPFATLMMGMVKNAYNYQVRKEKLAIKNLPKNLDGLKIVQISDIHSGSFVFHSPVEKAIELINEQQADFVFFTGDLVNYISSEAYSMMPILKQIKSKQGIYSTLGNHDYGDYVKWNSISEKEKNLQEIHQIHRDLGWDLLLNEHRKVKIKDEEIAVIGVENWSAKRNFKSYGNLQKAYQGAEKTSLKLLLSHDPTHWDGEVNTKYKDIDITFSGHTHGMQFGIEIPGFKWSPSQYIYKQWAGLYKQNGQYLYVNRGLGFLGYPGRVGILPEISVFELHSD